MSDLQTDVIDPLRLSQIPWLRGLEHHGSIGSTQERALKLAQLGRHPALPMLIVAEQQTAGRGRGGNSWHTEPGSLAFSLQFEPEGWGLSPKGTPQRSLAVSVAVVNAVAPLLPGHQIGLHWPNDVFVEDRKLAGVLVDVSACGLHTVGVGLNVNNHLQGAPAELQNRATSLRTLAGRTVDRTQLLHDILEQIRVAFFELAADELQFGQHFDRLCLQRGRELTVEQAGERIVGICKGVQSDGALLLETPSGTKTIYSGVLR